MASQDSRCFGLDAVTNAARSPNTRLLRHMSDGQQKMRPTVVDSAPDLGPRTVAVWRGHEQRHKSHDVQFHPSVQSLALNSDTQCHVLLTRLEHFCAPCSKHASQSA